LNFSFFQEPGEKIFLPLDVFVFQRLYSEEIGKRSRVPLKFILGVFSYA